MSAAQLYFYEELEVGMSHQKEYTISQAVYEDFLRLFGDASPLHIDAAYCKQSEFDGILMHGAILNGFISNFVGMVFPGGRGLELSVDIRFLQPCFVGDTIRVEGKVAQKLDAHRVVVMHLAFTKTSDNVGVANARVQIKMMPT